MFKEFHYQVRGRGHVREGLPVQDRVRFISRGGVQVMCLADGAGSAEHSAIGAQALVDEGCAVFADRFSEFAAATDGAALKVELLELLQAKLRAVAAKHALEVRELASTFLCVAIAGDKFIGIHVGDGVIGYVKSGELRPISHPDNDEFANQTTFVTSSRAAESTRLFRGSLDNVQGFILMSDGSADSLYNTRTGQLAPACTKLIDAVSHAPASMGKNSKYRKRLKRFMDLKVRTATSDDCSIGVLGRS